MLFKRKPTKSGYALKDSIGSSGFEGLNEVLAEGLNKEFLLAEFIASCDKAQL
jgi:hypothetical protein